MVVVVVIIAIIIVIISIIIIVIIARTITIIEKLRGEREKQDPGVTSDAQYHCLVTSVHPIPEQ